MEAYYDVLFGVAKRMIQKLSGVDIGDLIGHGTIGLFDAILKYDPAMNVRFEHYAAQRVRGAMLDGLRREDPMGRAFRRRSKLIEETAARLEHDLLRPATEEEILRATGLSRERFDNARGAMAVVHDPENTSIMEDVPDARARDVMGSMAAKDIFRRARRRLPKKDYRIFSMYFKDGLTLKEIGGRLRMSESRMCQIMKRSIDALKHLFHGRKPVPEAP